MADDSSWWPDFFRNAWTRVQASGYPEQRTRAEVDFAIQTLGLAPGARVLDLPCGEGRHAIELAARGFAVLGADFNPAAIELARARARERNVELKLVEADMREPLAAGDFDAALCLFSSFGYFSDADNLRAARAYASALRDGGSLLLDTHVSETVLPRFQERGWAWSGEPEQSVRILDDRRYDHETGRIHSSWTFIDPGGGIASAHSSIRLYTYRELCELFRAVGFSALRGVETLTGTPFALGARRLSLIATK